MSAVNAGLSAAPLHPPTRSRSGTPDSFWQAVTPTGNALVDATNPAAMNATVQRWYEGLGKYGVKAIWMDESEPDHLQCVQLPGRCVGCAGLSDMLAR